MQNDNGLKAYYLEIYKEFKKAEARAKKLIKPALPLEKEVKNLIRETRQIRKELHEIFAYPALYQICNQCHKQHLGGCCKGKTDSYMRWGDLVYVMAENLNFKFPDPDIKFLTFLEKPACIFLGSEGCLLKEKRPIECLTHICDDLRLGVQRLTGDRILQEGQIFDLTNNLNKKTRLLFLHILSKSKVYSYKNLDSLRHTLE